MQKIEKNEIVGTRMVKKYSTENVKNETGVKQIKATVLPDLQWCLSVV